MRILGVSEARQNLPELVEEADDHRDELTILRYSEPKAVLIGYERFQQILDRLDDLEDMLAIYQTRGEPARSLDEVREELNNERRQLRSPATT